MAVDSFLHSSRNSDAAFGESKTPILPGSNPMHLELLHGSNQWPPFVQLIPVTMRFTERSFVSVRLSFPVSLERWKLLQLNPSCISQLGVFNGWRPQQEIKSAARNNEKTIRNNSERKDIKRPIFDWDSLTSAIPVARAATVEGTRRTMLRPLIGRIGITRSEKADRIAKLSPSLFTVSISGSVRRIFQMRRAAMMRRSRPRKKDLNMRMKPATIETIITVPAIPPL